jgi:hypothetical protein
MPGTFNGTGTMYYGQREVGPDGSYITTKWLTVAWIPFIPLSSYRVLPQGRERNFAVYQSQKYVIQRVPLNIAQVRDVYLVAVPIALTVTALLFWFS